MNDPLRIGNRATWIALAVAALGLGSCGPAGSAAQASATPPGDSSPAPCDQAKAEAAYSVATARGVIVGQDASRADGIVILVNARRWRELGFAGQQRLAAMTDCGVAGPGQHLTALRFREDRSGADLYALEATDLLKLRKEGWAG